MKFINRFDKYTLKRKRTELIKESIMTVNDIYKVKTMIDVPQSLINAYIKKVKDNSGKNARQFWSDTDIAEEIVKYISSNYMNVDSIPTSILVGGEDSTTASQPAPSEPEKAPVDTPQAQASDTPGVEIENVEKAEINEEPSGDTSTDFEDVEPSKDEEDETTEGDEESHEETSEEDELPM